MTTGSLPAPQSITGLSEVFGLYEGFILDLWGVVHDGVAPFPDTIPALTALKKAKRKVWLLSNAPRRSYIVVKRLTEMGISPELYDGILTSGEASWQALGDTLLKKWGRRCLHIGGAHDVSLYEGLDIEIVTDYHQADFVLNSGVVNFSDSAGEYSALLQNCVSRHLPMLCANPDKIVHVQNQLVICAGTLADMYKAQHGEVVSFGKPYREVYSRCLQEMGTRRVLAVGDSMLTDIEGATGAGLDSVLVTSGIHREEFPAGVKAGPSEAFWGRYAYRPNYVIKSFSW